MYFVVSHTSGSISKEKRVVEYRLIDTRIDNVPLLGTIPQSTISGCYMACVETAGCENVNYCNDNNLCEMMETPYITGGPEFPTQFGCINVKLSTLPLFFLLANSWQSVPRNHSIGAECWTWSFYDRSAPLPEDMLMVFPDATVVSVFYYGRFTPAHFRLSDESSQFAMETPFIRARFLVSAPPDPGRRGIYVFRNTGGCSTSWLNFTIGYSLPPNAMVAGFEHDGAPLYVIESGQNIGNYNHEKQEAMVYNGRQVNPSDMSILVVN